MDQVKRTYCTVTDVEETARGVDRTDFKDQVGNAGDEIGKDLGNMGDVRTAGWKPRRSSGDPAPTPERPI